MERIDRGDAYSIANDWIDTHRDIVGDRGWLSQAVKDCKRMYTEVEWSRRAVRLLREELEYSKPVGV
jgi:hypothetical protein